MAQRRSDQNYDNLSGLFEGASKVWKYWSAFKVLSPKDPLERTQIENCTQNKIGSKSQKLVEILIFLGSLSKIVHFQKMLIARPIFIIFLIFFYRSIKLEKVKLEKL